MCEFIRAGVPCEGHGDGTETSQAGATIHALPTTPATPEAAEWQGWGTALKPAFEPVVVARKPISGTVAANVLAHGTGALNIDGCRVEGGPISSVAGGTRRSGGIMGESTPLGGWEPSHTGRWPANVALDPSTAAEVDRQSGQTTSRKGDPARGTTKRGMFANSEFNQVGSEYDDAGGASRFFYVAKATQEERPNVDGIAHPTVKPLALMRWLVRLVSPPGGLVLEPFAGSGTTVEACIREGVRCIAIEREADYLPLIHARIERNNLSLFADLDRSE
jgi:site-specific DNA-methyltransferase (adenine-specific)